MASTTTEQVRSTPAPAAPNRRKRHPTRFTPLVPAIILLALFMLGPIVWSFYGSFTNSALTGSAALHPEFIGLDNYVKLFSSSVFPKSLLLTLVFVIGSAVVGQTVLGLLLAILMRGANSIVRGVVGTIVVAAWVLPEIVSAFVGYAYFSGHGTLNAILSWLHVPTVDWLFSAPMLAVILANTWRGTAFSMMLYSAALTNVPTDVLEAATVDGAGEWRKLFSVTLPMIRRTITTTLMLITLQTLSIFTLIYVMTAGGPGFDSSTLPILAYQQAFKFSNLGYGTAIATILLIVGAAFSVIYLRVLKPKVN
ncbi:carbohydrate ABC transporter permease [Spelaeicoccus albus]|uniref:Multiple sugar transport system permease protein n=1 Tax=Spelaeicoccus albus TaxID=1280376 RepID=A0A7Z0IJ69_9MICO|nr:multiple sugar transport system permease protein [Spelaeicoccus albus]